MPLLSLHSSAVEHGTVQMPQMQLAPPQSAELAQATSQLVFLCAVSVVEQAGARGSASATKNIGKIAARFMTLPRLA
jgi:hypothetical protein